MHNLGLLFESGKLGQSDPARAREWYSKAAALGFDASKERLASLEKGIVRSPKQQDRPNVLSLSLSLSLSLCLSPNFEENEI